MLTAVFPVNCPFESDLAGQLLADPDDEIAEADEGSNCGSILAIGQSQ